RLLRRSTIMTTETGMDAVPGLPVENWALRVSLLRLVVGLWLRVTLRHHHLHSVGGTEGHRGEWRNDGAGGKLEAEATGNRRQQEGRFHQGEIVAYAHPRAAAEGEIGVARKLVEHTVGPALWTEKLGSLEPAGVTVDRPLGHENRGPRRNHATAQLDRLGR